MNSSLRLRMLIAWAVFILVTLQIAGVGLRVLFERAITRRTISELEFDLRQLTRGLSIASDGTLAQSRRPTDPQFEVLYGGRYWQAEATTGSLLRSVSLGSKGLDIARPLPFDGSPIVLHLLAPDGKPLLGVGKTISLADPSDQPLRVVIVSAVNASEIKEDTDKFTADLIVGLLGLAVLLIAGAWIHVSVGLRPLDRIRESLVSIRSGRRRKLSLDFPREMMPLVEETNALIEARDTAVEAARARAGDLAHGLKTPLAIMAAKSRAARIAGNAAIADDIDRQIGVMHRHVQRELARARARGKSMGALANFDLSAAARELVSAIQSLPRATSLSWDLHLPPQLPFPVDRIDFNDVLGNLVDNAQKWAQSRVRVSAECLGVAVRLCVEDDGPGVEDAQFGEIAKRGVTTDPAGVGSGLGLSIVSDIVELYSGTFKLARSELGGLKAVVELPSQRHQVS